MKTKSIPKLIFFVVTFSLVFGLTCGLSNEATAATAAPEGGTTTTHHEGTPAAAPEPVRTPQPPEAAIQVNMPGISTDAAIGGQPANEPVELPNVANVEGDPVGPNVVVEENLVAPADAADLNIGQPEAGEVTQAPSSIE